MEASTLKISKSMLYSLNRLKIDISEYQKVDCSLQVLADTAVGLLLKLSAEEVAALIQERQAES